MKLTCGILIIFLSVTTARAAGQKLTFTPETGEVPGCYNIHGIEDDPALPPPSLDPDDWEILNDGNPVVRHGQTTGGRKIDPVGFYFTGNNLALLYNSGWACYDDWESGMATNQAGSLIAFNDDFAVVKDYPGNPVLYDWARSAWQSKNRVNPYALAWHPYHEVFYCFYGDFSAGADDCRYPGRRALGLAKSCDLINWEYITREEPLFHINTLKDLASRAGSGLFEGYEDVMRQGRVYAFGAVFHDNHVYLTVGGSIAREMDYTMVVRAKDPAGDWEFVESNAGGRGAHRPTPVFIAGRWYHPKNMRDPFDPDYRAIGIGVSDGITEPAEVHYILSTGHTSSAGASRRLFAYKGRWYIAYRQADDENYRDMYLAGQK